MSQGLSGKIILVSGGTGSIGSELVKQSLALGARKVIVFSRDETKHFMLRKRFRDDRLSTVVGDVRDIRSVEKAFDTKELIGFYPASVDILYHVAAMKHVLMCEETPMESAMTNIIGTQNVMDTAVKYGVPTAITISTDKAFMPTTAMGATKLLAERITLNAGYSCVRFGNVANSRGSVIPVYVEDLLNGNPLYVSNPDVTRFIMRISDAVKLIIESTDKLQKEIYVLPMPAFRLGDLVDVMVNRIAPKLKVKAQIEKGVPFPNEKQHESLSDNTSSEHAVMLTKDELEVIVDEYLKERLVEGNLLR